MSSFSTCVLFDAVLTIKHTSLSVCCSDCVQNDLKYGSPPGARLAYLETLQVTRHARFYLLRLVASTALLNNQAIFLRHFFECIRGPFTVRAEFRDQLWLAEAGSWQIAVGDLRVHFVVELYFSRSLNRAQRFS